MSLKNLESTNWRLGQFAFLMALVCGSRLPATAASFATSVFARGAGVGTAADSVTYGNGSVWIEYGNNAPSNNYTGSSTIVQYSMSGGIQNTYSMKGNVDGLKYNPNTGQVWALQNQDGNSQLNIINPATKAISTFTYGAPYPSVSASRGFDDVAFIGSNVFLSQTNPSSTSDAVVVKLNSSAPSSPVTYSTVLTGAGILATDPDSLKSTPGGGLILTGEHDGALTFISNPGLANQTANSVVLSGAGGVAIHSPDDSTYATASSGTFYITDGGTDMVYAISATGLTPNSSLFVNVGNIFGSVDPGTGVITPIFDGQSLHGMDFVPNAAAVPEPASLGISLLGLGLGVLAIAGKRVAK